MMKLKKRISLRIPDTLAVAATLALVVTAAVSMTGDRFGAGGEPETLNAMNESRSLPARAEPAEVSTERVGQESGFKLRLLLFRRG